MSLGTSVWRQTLERATRLRAVAPEASRPVAAVERPDPALAPLVRQLFFSSKNRTRIFFAAVDPESRIQDFCERMGKAIAVVPDARVAVVHGSAFKSRAADLGNAPPNPLEEYTCATHLSENLWRVPFGVFEAESNHGTAERPALAAFNYLLFGADISDCAAPLFCKACDGGVLVISANHTRREAALRAKDTLLGSNAELLGAVLVNRSFPVPEVIYRRL